MIEEGRQFDYVFGDLTDIPISTVPDGDEWDFIRLILNSSIKVLKPNGKYMTHVSCTFLRLNESEIYDFTMWLFHQGNGASCPESLSMFEEVLGQLSSPVKFTKSHAFVPSFFENWVFYQASLKWWSNGRVLESYNLARHIVSPVLWPKLLVSFSLILKTRRHQFLASQSTLALGISSISVAFENPESVNTCNVTSTKVAATLHSWMTIFFLLSVEGIVLDHSTSSQPKC